MRDPNVKAESDDLGPFTLMDLRVLRAAESWLRADMPSGLRSRLIVSMCRLNNHIVRSVPVTESEPR